MIRSSKVTGKCRLGDKTDDKKLVSNILLFTYYV